MKIRGTRRWAAAVAVALAAASQAAADAERALELANAARAEAGLPELALDAALVAAAEGHAADMLERDYYAHVSPDGETVLDR